MPKYKVPREVQKIAQRALDYNLSLPLNQRAAYKEVEGKRVAGTGIRTARRLISGAIDEEQARLMSAWFARHASNEAEAEARKDKTSKAAVAFALWGGNPGRRYAEGLIRKLENGY
jgi:hypothetical protein